jgi:hypothetical protein
MSEAEHRRAVGILNVVLGLAVAVSIVHYTDNYLAFDRYPQSDTGPTITDDSIWIAWLAFTSFGAAGYLLYRQGRVRLASALLAVYSVSGLIGLGHYSAPGMSELAWWRHLHIGADFLSGLAVFAFAAWSLQQTRRAAYS